MWAEHFWKSNLWPYNWVMNRNHVKWVPEQEYFRQRAERVYREIWGAKIPVDSEHNEWGKVGREEMRYKVRQGPTRWFVTLQSIEDVGILFKMGSHWRALNLEITWCNTHLKNSLWPICEEYYNYSFLLKCDCNISFHHCTSHIYTLLVSAVSWMTCRNLLKLFFFLKFLYFTWISHLILISSLYFLFSGGIYEFFHFSFSAAYFLFFVWISYILLLFLYAINV